MASRKTGSPKGAAVPRTLVWAYTGASLCALAGLADAIYLTVMHLTGQSAVCGAGLGCSQVLGSKYAQIGPVPTALFGVLGYFSVFALSVFAACGSLTVHKALLFAVGAMFLGTLWFLYLQAFVLHAFCPYCLFSAAMTFILMGLVIAITPSGSA